MINRPFAARLIAVEYLQNFPILLGLVAAVRADQWGARLILLGAGTLLTAILIALTDRYKHEIPLIQAESAADTLINGIGFFAGGSLYLLYAVLFRAQIALPWRVDLILGGLIGGLVGLFQARFVDERRISRAALTHAFGLALAGGLVFMLIGVLSVSLPPFAAAVLLCTLMTVIIVGADYWPRLIRPPAK
jgi:hypothetical protein